MFHVGQMVVCVDDSVSPANFFIPATYPSKGHIYTIRGIQDLGNGLAVLLEEILNRPFPYATGDSEPSFLASRFRPVRQTSIEQFTSILNQAPQREDA